LTTLREATRKPRNRLAISTLAIAIVLFVIIGIALEVTLLPKASSPGATTTAGSTLPGTGTPSTPVKTSVDQFIKDFNTRDVQGLGNFYSQNAAVSWTGNAGGLTGNYNGQQNIRILYGSSIGKTLFLNASSAGYHESAANPANVNVTMTINLNGNSSVVGTLSSNIAATQQWAYNGQWQIVRENWDYKTFVVQYPVSATTFPQWGALKTGQNPNLVSEKSFEWNAGPYVAATVYAFLVAIAVAGITRYRGRARTG